jgi:hypothetical protein
MKKSYMALAPLLAALGVVALTGAAEAASWFSLERKNEVEPVQDQVYKDECGSCHMAYQPGLLPARSWGKLLDAEALADHFGENAELPAQTRAHLLDYLVSHAADKSDYKRSRKLMASLEEGETPVRITEIAYIRRKHHEIPARLIQGEKVKSLSYCDACHTKAAQGEYDEDTVIIPGKGKWSW